MKPSKKQPRDELLHRLGGRTSKGNTMKWREGISGWYEWMKAAGRPHTTLALRLYQIRRFAYDHADPKKVTERQLVQWIADQDWSIETRRSYRAALRSFYGWAQARGLTDINPAKELPSIKPTEPRPRPAPEEVLDSALAAADARVQLMLLLAARQGLRRGEIAQIHTRDVARNAYGWSLRVHGKGNKERVVPLLDEVARRLREVDSGWVFPGQIEGHISAKWVGTLVKRTLREGWTTHTLRHRFATAAYHGSRDLLAVQQLLGHSRPETTKRYVQLPDDSLRAALKFAA